jgi:hypothetical protein
MPAVRSTALFAVLGWALAVAAQAQDRPTTFTPAGGAAAAIAIAGAPPHYERATTDGRSTLLATPACSETRPRAIDVPLAWAVEDAAVEQVRIDITRFGAGFANGSYLTSGSLPGRAGEALFADAEPGIFYYWRLLTRPAGADAWKLAANGRFEAPICPFDEVEP